MPGYLYALWEAKIRVSEPHQSNFLQHFAGRRLLEL
jgi:hypothetical protein